MTRRHLPTLLTVGALLAGTAALAGCGGGRSGSSATAAAPPATAAARGKVVRLKADPSGALRFTRSHVTVAKPGVVTLRMTNPSSAGMDHGIAIEGPGVDRDGPIVAPGNVSTVTATLRKGSYVFYCPVPGHRQAGMQGMLMVR